MMTEHSAAIEIKKKTTTTTVYNANAYHVLFFLYSIRSTKTHPTPNL